jgi:hypothetical protein
MAKFLRDFETTEEARKRLASEDQAEPLMVEEPALPPLVIKPGYIHARAAYRAGREDEYIDRMQSRYGGEW